MNVRILAAFAAVGFLPIFMPDGNAATAQETLTREMAIERILAATPALDALRNNVEAHQAAIRQAGFKPNPFLTAETENFTGTGPFTGLGRSEITFTYSQRFERGGKRQSRMRAAQTGKKIAVTQWHINRLDIIRAAEQAYIAVLVAQANLDNLQRQAKIFADIHSVIEKRMARGKDSRLAVQSAKLRLSAAQNQVAKAERTAANARRSLASLWQMPDAMFTINTDVLFDLPKSLKVAEKSVAESGPDLEYWKLQQERSTNLLAVEKANAVQDPTFKVGVRYLQGTSDVAAVAGVSIPFALYNTNAGNISKAKASRRKSQHDLLEAERQLERHILLQQNARAAAYVQAKEILEDLIPEALLTEQLVVERLEQGVASYLDVFAAQTLSAELQNQLITELEHYQLAEAELNRLTAKYADDDGLDATSTDEGAALQDSEGN